MAPVYDNRKVPQSLRREINESAHLIKFGALGSWARDNEMNHLGRLLLNFKMRNILGKDVINTSFNTCEVVAYDIFIQAYEYAFGDFMESAGCGDVVADFASLFECYYNGGRKFKTVTLPDGRIVSRDNVEFKIRSANAKRRLKEAARTRAERYRLPKGLVTPSRFIEEMIRLGYSYEDARKISEEIYDGSHEASLETCAEMIHEDGREVDALGPLIDSYEKVVMSTEVSPRDKVFARYLITGMVRDHGIKPGVGISHMLDEGFLDELRRNPDRTMQEVLCSLLGIKPDTVRKNLKSAKDCLRRAA